MSAKDQGLVIGGEPRVDLLPPSIREARRTKSVVRMLVAAVVVVAILVVAGVGFAVIRSVSAGVALSVEQNRTNSLLAEQTQYADARSISRQIDEAKIALALGTATEIDWRAYLEEVNATLPPGVTLTSVTVDSVSPADTLPAAEAPLQEDWVASLTIEATSLTVPDVKTWLENLEGLTGFAGVAPPVTVSGTPESGYVASIQINVNDKAYTLRFQDEDGAE
ncbi:PilN domain-containing protein [Diaminobutyricimonas sp. TR449]|uniref:PilN domain-containing protein n=1 Tax=Diaminobutyricimonas sp. TR449 TaxID=2708076 RepID=UPI001423BD0D|nr:PilN domain-containing protein [Diaminobutyricimonas sp. TR449]